MGSPVKYRCSFLLIAIILMLLSSPLIDDDGNTWSRLALGLVWAGVIGVGGYLVSASRKWLSYYAVAIGVVAVSILTDILVVSNTWIHVAQNVGIISIQSCALYAALSYSLSRERGTPLDRTLGSISGYFLIGLVWSRLFILVQLFDPHAFSVAASESDLIYYSFVNLTTLGYGDIIPLNNLARVLATLESACGTLYLAVLVATLVSELRSKKSDAP